MFKKILIANRGEIAMRLIRTCKEMGIKTVAVYSTADQESLHVRFADEAVCIGPAPSTESYLKMANIMAAAEICNADAIHPGYGFLSENADFAKKCKKENLIFIGPDYKTIDTMGNKKIAKSIAMKVGVPCLDDYSILSNEKMFKINQKAKNIGYPIMLKATNGGGGKGMRLVLEQKDLKSSLNLAKAESMSAFGSDEIIIEKALIKPRHIEVQIFGDNFGNFIHLGERDCSVQRRHQKIIEEAPAKGISNEVRNKLGELAINLAKAINYEGAGTVEFLIDQNQNFFFLEMNTRLQVEHPVTEMITGYDLVELQLIIADGQQLPINQDNVNLNGYAVEVRLYAEDPLNDFFPSFGKINDFSFSNSKNIRIDSGIEKNQTVSSFYDPMVAKIISYSETRNESIKQLLSFLSNLSLIGIKNNRDFLIDILSHKEFMKGQINTSFIEEFYPDGFISQNPQIIDFIAFAYMIFKNEFNFSLKKTSGIPEELQHWCNFPNIQKSYKINCLGKVKNVNVKCNSLDSFELIIDNKIHRLDFLNENIMINNIHYDYNKLHVVNDTYYLIKDKIIFEFSKALVSTNEILNLSSGEILSPMHGVISKVNVTSNKKVSKGETLFILEAMKMQHEIKADIDGLPTDLRVKENSQVSTGDLLVKISTKS